MMRKYTLSLVSVLLCFGLSSVQAQTSLGCEQKAQSIERKIEQAKRHGNTHREQGLQRALLNVRTHCTDDSLIAEIDENIAEQQADINELLEDIAEVRAEGNVKKVTKLERKLAAKQAELKELELERRSITR